MESRENLKDIPSGLNMESSAELKDILSELNMESSEELKEIPSELNSEELKDIPSEPRMESSVELKDIPSGSELSMESTQSSEESSQQPSSDSVHLTDQSSINKSPVANLRAAFEAEVLSQSTNEDSSLRDENQSEKNTDDLMEVKRNSNQDDTECETTREVTPEEEFSVIEEVERLRDEVIEDQSYIDEVVIEDQINIDEDKSLIGELFEDESDSFDPNVYMDILDRIQSLDDFEDLSYSTYADQLHGRESEIAGLCSTRIEEEVIEKNGSEERDISDHTGDEEAEEDNTEKNSERIESEDGDVSDNMEDVGVDIEEDNTEKNSERNESEEG